MFDESFDDWWYEDTTIMDDTDDLLSFEKESTEQKVRKQQPWTLNDFIGYQYPSQQTAEQTAEQQEIEARTKEEYKNGWMWDEPSQSWPLTSQQEQGMGSRQYTWDHTFFDDIKDKQQQEYGYIPEYERLPQIDKETKMDQKSAQLWGADALMGEQTQRYGDTWPQTFKQAQQQQQQTDLDECNRQINPAILVKLMLLLFLIFFFYNQLLGWSCFWLLLYEKKNKKKNKK